MEELEKSVKSKVSERENRSRKKLEKSVKGREKTVAR